MPKLLPTFYFLLVGLFLLPAWGKTQRLRVTGTVYDITKKTPVEAVSVISTGGAGTITDSLGKYSIMVSERDSIYFSYQNKPTPKFPVTSIGNTAGFDISIMKKVAELPNVFVKPRNYRLDSIQNRQDYAKIFNYKKPGLSSTMAPNSGAGVGLDMVELINMFRFRRNRSMLAFQNRLLKEEEDKFIDHRFSKALVRKLTRLSSPELEKFMKVYRPTLDMVKSMNDLEFGQFIVDAYEYYSTGTNKRYAGQEALSTDQ